MPHVQRELHRIAAHYMAGDRPGHELQATALINEAYIRLVDWQDIQWADRAHFFGMARRAGRMNTSGESARTEEKAHKIHAARPGRR